MDKKIVVDIKKGFISFIDKKYCIGDFSFCQEARRAEIFAINRTHVIFKGGYCLSIFQFCLINFNEHIPKKYIEIILI